MTGETPAVHEALAVYAPETTETGRVPGRYKQTEVGVIPEDWDIVSVRDIGHIKTGPFGTLLKANEYSRSGGVPLISVREVGEGTLRVDDNTPLISPAVVRRLPEYVLKRGDIVFGRKGAVDRSALILDKQSGWFLGSDGIRIRLSKAFYPPFVIYQFQSKAIQSWLLQHATGTTMASLNQEILGRVNLPLPPLHEQRAIAAALSDVDALISALDNLISKKRAVKTAVMQQLLTGKQRLPGFSGEWEVKRLGDYAEISSGGTPSSNILDYYDGSVPWASITDMTKRGKYVSATDRNLTEKGLANSAARMFPKGTILYAMYASIGECSIADVELSTSQAILGIKPSKSLNTDYLYFVLISRKEAVQSLGQQGTQANLNAGIVKGFSVPLPSLEEQTAIAAVLSDMDAEIEALEARREKTRQVKGGMMQELLTGRTRLV